MLLILQLIRAILWRLGLTRAMLRHKLWSRLKIWNELTPELLPALFRQPLKLLKPLAQLLLLLRFELPDPAKVLLYPLLLSRFEVADPLEIIFELLELFLADRARFLSNSFSLLFRHAVPACEFLFVTEFSDHPGLGSILRSNVASGQQSRQTKH